MQIQLIGLNVYHNVSLSRVNHSANEHMTEFTLYYLIPLVNESAETGTHLTSAHANHLPHVRYMRMPYVSESFLYAAE